jgi:hypothetical protein
MEQFTPKFYEKVYDILVELAGAPPSMKEHFVYCLTEDGDDRFRDTFEYRFGGKFGFGGKFWRRVVDYKDGVTIYNHDVNYYREDHTKALDKLQAEINERLTKLTTNFVGK